MKTLSKFNRIRIKSKKGDDRAIGTVGDLVITAIIVLFLTLIIYLWFYQGLATSSSNLKDSAINLADAINKVTDDFGCKNFQIALDEDSWIAIDEQDSAVIAYGKPVSNFAVYWFDGGPESIAKTQANTAIAEGLLTGGPFFRPGDTLIESKSDLSKVEVKRVELKYSYRDASGKAYEICVPSERNTLFADTACPSPAIIGYETRIKDKFCVCRRIYAPNSIWLFPDSFGCV